MKLELSADQSSMPSALRARHPQRGAVVALCLAGSLSAFAAVPASAQLVPARASITASHDAHVDRLATFRNFGRSALVEIDGVVKPEHKRGVVRFNQSDIAAVVGARKFVSAKLVLTMSAPATSWGMSPKLVAYRLTKSWLERSATWASLFFPFEPFDSANPSAEAVVLNGAAGTVEFDVSNDVAAFLGGTANNGWLIKDDGWVTGVAADFRSRESSSGKPQLVIETLDANVEVAGEAVVTFPEKGVLLVDSSSGGEILEIPEVGMSFGSKHAAIEWAAANLNAHVERDLAGNAIDAYGTAYEIGRFFYVDEKNRELVEIDDIVATLLGGRRGIVTIAGVEYCLRDDGCEEGLALKAPPSVHRPCNSGKNFCIKSESFKTNALVYKSIGTKLEQREGGFSKERHFCWKARFIPWSCVRKKGQNRLELQNRYQFGGSGQLLRFKSGTNTEKITQKEWSLFASIKVKDDGSVVPGKPGADLIVEGVCAFGLGRDPRGERDFANSNTSKGDVSYVCPDYM